MARNRQPRRCSYMLRVRCAHHKDILSSTMSCPPGAPCECHILRHSRPGREGGLSTLQRCKPEDLRAPTDPHVRLAQKACETMTLAALAGGEKQRPTLQDLASEAGLTPSHFHRVFKKVVGVTPGKYARDLLEGKTFQKKLPDGTIIGWPPVGPIGTTTSAQLQPQTQAQTPPSIPVPTTVPAAVQGIGLDLSNQSTGHDPGAVGIDWNEFDLMLAATTGGARPQMDYIGNVGQPPPPWLSGVCQRYG
ncbi:ADA regulatory protein [Coccidioides immitis H538.4]|uniref:ADA regulatory protein n=1 Tax=Coccidioides immitis H538.4 TaxID=396776 RepID=A0A0J8RIK3_COCIT|nr:ADA regulatory protein [Coccidioides immitis H538.4]